MLCTTIARIDEGDVPRLREWLASLPARRQELDQSYRDQGTRHEQFFLIRTQHTPVLVLISEVESLEHATTTFLRSTLPIDVEFKALYKQISLEEAGVELLYDSRGLDLVTL